MKQGLEKKLMLDLLMHPAEVIFKDENIAVIRPNGIDSLVHHLKVGKGKFRFQDTAGARRGLSNSNNKMIVATRKGERFMAYLAAESFMRPSFNWEFAPYTEPRLLKTYPTLIDAFNDIAIKINYLPLIKEHTKEVIEAAIKQDPANIRYVRNLTEKDKKYWIMQKSATFEYMQQTKELARFAMDNTDIGLGEISSYFCSASVCKKGLRKNPLNWKYVPTEHRTNDLLIYAIQQDPQVLNQVKTPTTEMYVAAVRSGKNAWDYVPESMKKKVKKLA